MTKANFQILLTLAILFVFLPLNLSENSPQSLPFSIIFSFYRGKSNNSIPIVYINQYRGIFRARLNVSNYYRNGINIHDNTFFLRSTDFILKGSPIMLSTDENTKDFYLAAKKSTKPGLYNISLDVGKENETIINSNSLLIEVVEQECEIKTDILTYTLPMKGQTFPIIIDFSECQPISTLEISAIIVNGKGGITFDDGFLNKRLIINSNVKNKLFLFVKSNFDEMGLRNFNFSINPWVEWELNSESKNYFKISKRTDLKLSFIRNDEFFKLKPMVNFLKNNELEIILIFQQEIFYFFSLMLTNYETSSSFYALYKRIMSSDRDNNSQNLKEYSDIAYDFVKSSKFEVRFKNLRPNTNYSLIYYYADHFKISEKQEIVFISPDNLSRYVKLSLRLGKNLKSHEKQTLSCLLAYKYNYKRNRVWTDEGTNCDENKIIQNISIIAIRNLNENNNIQLTSINYPHFFFFDISLEYEGSLKFLKEISADFSSIASANVFFLENVNYISVSEVFDTKVSVKSQSEIINAIIPDLELINYEIKSDSQNEEITSLILRIKIIKSDGFLYLGLCEDNRTSLDFLNLRNASCLASKCCFRNMYLIENKPEELIFHDLKINHHYYGYYMLGGDYAPSFENYTYSDIRNFTIITDIDNDSLKTYLIESLICCCSVTIFLMIIFLGVKILQKKKIIYLLHNETSIKIFTENYFTLNFLL